MLGTIRAGKVRSTLASTFTSAQTGESVVIASPERSVARWEFVPGARPAWFEIEPAEHGTRLRHVETMDFGHGVLGWLYDLVARRWFARGVEQEVREIARLLADGERGRGVAAHATPR